jgi:hypothetical protein
VLAEIVKARRLDGVGAPAPGAAPTPPPEPHCPS